MITFPEFTGLRCLMMPYIQGEPESVPQEYAAYEGIIAALCLERGKVGHLTIDELLVTAGSPHRGYRAKHGRALHTEAGLIPTRYYCWGGSVPTWGGSPKVTLDRGTRILLASNVDDSCAVWDDERTDTTDDGDIGHLAYLYPYDTADLLRAGEVREIGILTPHESLPVQETCHRQFLRIVGAGVHGRESYFTQNPLVNGP